MAKLLPLEGTIPDFNNLIEALPDPAIYIGEDQRVLAANQAAEELFGIGISGRHYVTAMRNPALLGAIEAVLSGSEAVSVNIHMNAFGRELILESHVAPVRASENSGALASITDITRLEEVDQQKRDFVANVSHELKTPLTAILGLMETLRGPAREDAAARDRFLSIMETEALRMNRLIVDLLSLTRVESHEYDLPRNEVDLIGLVHSVALTLQPQADEQKTAIRLDLEALPEEELTLRGDEQQLRQLLTNLVENGVKYGGSSESDVVISLSLIEREPALRARAVQIDVSDRGPGIDPIHIPRLTERFYRVDTHRSRQKGGTGLGLAIVKHIVNRHRGRMRIISKSGEGSTFRVILPLD